MVKLYLSDKSKKIQQKLNKVNEELKNQKEKKRNATKNGGYAKHKMSRLDKKFIQEFYKETRKEGKSKNQFIQNNDKSNSNKELKKQREKERERFFGSNDYINKSMKELLESHQTRCEEICKEYAHTMKTKPYLDG